MFSTVFRTYGEQKRIAARIAKYQEALHELDEMLMGALAALRASSQYLDKSVEQSEALTQLRIATMNTDLIVLLKEFADLMCLKRKSAGAYYLPHAEHINAVFYHFVRVVAVQDVLAAVELIAHPQNALHLTSTLYQGQSKDLFAQSIVILAAKCPIEHKAQFYMCIEQGGYLSHTFGQASCQYKAQFLSDIFDGAPLPDVMEVLKSSPLWNSQPKTAALRKAIQDQDERLLPILDV